MTEIEEEEDKIVVDLGSGILKLGFAGDNAPRSVYPNLIGIPRTDHKKILQGSTQEEIYVGDEANQKAGMCSLSYPLEDGEIRDIPGLQKTLTHGFYNELRCDTKDKFMLLTEAPSNPRQNREKLVDLVFNEFHVCGTYVAMQAVLALYASGRTTGLVLDVGDGCTHTCPIYQGFCLVHSVFKQKVAGRHVTDQMLKLIGIYSDIRLGDYTSGRMVAEKIKQTLGFVSLDYKNDLNEAKTMNKHSATFTLPDKQVITVREPRFIASECLFDPLQIGKEGKGTIELVKASHDKTDVNIRTELMENIVLSGGTTCLSQYESRLKDGIIKNVIAKGQQIKVISSEERNYSVWIGGSILASLSTFQSSWLTRDEYNDRGATAIHAKCLGAGSE